MIFRATKRAISDRHYTGGNMSIDMKDLPAAVQRQILKQMRDADAKRAEKGARERTATVASALAVTGEKENKLHAKRTADGHASIREADRAAELKIMQKAGQIRNLREQVTYVLVPAIYAKPDGTLVKNYDPSKNKRDLEKAEGCKLELLERNTVYQADFVYEQDGQTIVEDAKGMRKTDAAVYRIFANKRKLMLHIYGIRVREV
jgi:hypothetical protein